MNDQLNEAVSRITAAVATIGEKVTAEAQQVRDAMAALQQPDPNVGAAVDTLNTLAARLDAIGIQIEGIVDESPASPEDPSPDTGEQDADAGTDQGDGTQG